MTEKIYAGAVAEIQEELERLMGVEKYLDGLLKISFNDGDSDRMIEISRQALENIHTQVDCAIDGIHYHLDPAPEAGAA